MPKLNIEEAQLPLEQRGRKEWAHKENLKGEAKKDVITLSGEVNYVE